MKQVTTKSGIRGYQCRLTKSYKNLAEFIAFSNTYGLAEKLGFKSAAEAWKANPLIQGSTNPDDFCVVSEPTTKKEAPEDIEGFTGGEWRVKKLGRDNEGVYHSSVWAYNALNQANGVCNTHGRTQLEADSNAILIASAPRLYRENKRLSEQLSKTSVAAAKHCAKIELLERDNKELKEVLQALQKLVTTSNLVFSPENVKATELINRIK